jgi:hypothetical protein
MGLKNWARLVPRKGWGRKGLGHGYWSMGRVCGERKADIAGASFMSLNGSKVVPRRRAEKMPRHKKGWQRLIDSSKLRQVSKCHHNARNFFFASAELPLPQVSNLPGLFSSFLSTLS